MMRRWTLLVLLAGWAYPGFAAKPVTVDQLTQLLQRAHGKPDAKLAQQLSFLELSERVTAARLSQWKAAAPGLKTQEALTVLADASEFRDLPRADVPAVPAPDDVAQYRMKLLAVKYLSEVLVRLPNFLATRNTLRFEDTPEREVSPLAQGQRITQTADALPQHIPYEPLHVVGSSKVRVVYRDGREVLDAERPEEATLSLPRQGGQAAPELVTPGLFGPILGVVFHDARGGAFVWHHWEQGPSGLLAVFRYNVPLAASHYSVAFPSKEQAVQRPSAYHGEVAVDPHNGIIVRLTQVADPDPAYPILKANIMAEYGAVEIGGAPYICPLRSVALFQWKTPGKQRDFVTGPVETKLNDVAFTDYHIFRSEARIVTGGVASFAPAPASGGAAATPVAPPAAALETKAEPAAKPVAQAQPSAPVAAAVPELAADAVSKPAPQVESGDAALAAGTAALPDQSSLTLPLTAPVIRLDTNMVLVDAVVTDHGNAVHGLERRRFHIFEDGHEQQIKSFDEFHPDKEQPGDAAPAHLPPHTYTNMPLHHAHGAINVLLLDGLNTPVVNQSEVRAQMLDYVGNMAPGGSLAIFQLGLSLKMIQGFTTDPDRLAAALRSSNAAPVNPVVLDQDATESLRREATKLEQLSGVPAADVPPPVSAQGGATAQGNQAGSVGLAAARFRQSAADITAELADRQVSMTLSALQQLALSLSAIPGRKNLIWFSGSFPIDLAPDTSLVNPFSPMRNYADQLRETGRLLAAARVAVYPVYALGLTSARSSQASYSFVSRPGLGLTPTMKDDARILDRTRAEHASMLKIAEETGGRYFNSNGFKEAMEKAVEDGASYYTLGYVPSLAGDEKKFRNIQVRLDKSHYDLSYRRGYFADRLAQSSPLRAEENEIVRTATLLGAPPATQIQFRARVLPASDPSVVDAKLPANAGGDLAASLKGPVKRYIVDYAIDPHDLIFAELPGGAHQAGLEYTVFAYDAAGKRVNSVDQGVQLILKPTAFERAMGAGVFHRLAIDLPQGETELRIVVADPAASRVGSLEVPVTVQ